jgi:ERCC4-type nuclease
MERASYIHPNALDALLERVKEKGIEIIEGFNALHSAGLIYGILFPDGKESAKAGQRLPVIRTRKGLDSMNDEQEFFIAGFPGVNVVRAKSLLGEFGSPLEVVNRTDEWSKISGIGPKTISNARRMLTSPYKPADTEDE